MNLVCLSLLMVHSCTVLVPNAQTIFSFYDSFTNIFITIVYTLFLWFFFDNLCAFNLSNISLIRANTFIWVWALCVILKYLVICNNDLFILGAFWHLALEEWNHLILKCIVRLLCTSDSRPHACSRKLSIFVWFHLIWLRCQNRNLV
jgi:hypothetical protein